MQHQPALELQVQEASAYPRLLGGQGTGAQLVPNPGEKREESSGRQCTNRSVITACPSSG